MAYDENIRIIAEELERLKNQIRNLDVEIPPHAAADSGKILAVDSEGDLEWKTEYSYIPPAYSSTEEVNTGKKWIDGKDIYNRVFTGNIGEITQTVNRVIISDFQNNLLYCDYKLDITDSTYFNRFVVYQSGENIYILNASTAFSNADFIFIAYYTKPDPEPETETKAKKKGAK